MAEWDFILLLGLCLTCTQRDFVEKSISKWTAFCEEALAGVGASARPIFRGELVLPVAHVSLENKEEDVKLITGENQGKKKKDKKDRNRKDTEGTLSEASTEPSFTATATSKQIEMTPSAGQLKESLLQPLHSLVSIVRAIKAVDATLLPLLQLEPEPIFNLKSGDPMCAEADAMLGNAFSKISNLVDNAVAAPLEWVSHLVRSLTLS